MWSQKETIQRFEPPIEAMVEAGEPIDILGIELFPKSDESLNKLIQEYTEELERGDILGVHETTQDSAEQILTSGFNRTTPRTTEDSRLRANSTFFWIHDCDIGNRPPNTGEHYLVFCRLVEGHAFVSSYGSIQRYAGRGQGEKYEEEELLLSHTYVNLVERGVTVDREHDIDSLLVGEDE